MSIFDGMKCPRIVLKIEASLSLSCVCRLACHMNKLQAGSDS